MTAQPVRGPDVVYEILGLILLVVGVLLCFSLYAPYRYVGGLGSLLKLWLAKEINWVTYLFPLPFLTFGLAVFTRQSQAVLMRMFWIVVAVLLLASSILLAADLLKPGSAGEAVRGLGYLLTRSVGIVGMLLPLSLMGLSLEVLFRWPPFFLAKTLSAALGMLAVLTYQKCVALYHSGQAATQLSIRRLSLKRRLEACQHNLRSLSDLYPQSPELVRWQSEAQSAIHSISKSPAEALDHLTYEVDQWERLIGEFTALRAGDLKKDLIEEQQRLPQWVITPSNGLQQSSPLPAVEAIRRVTLLDAQRLQVTTTKLERERAKAERQLLEHINATQLEHELKAHQQRMDQWKTAIEQGNVLERRMADLLPWVEWSHTLTAEPRTSIDALQTAFKMDPESTLRNIDLWKKQLQERETDDLPEDSSDGYIEKLDVPHKDEAHRFVPEGVTPTVAKSPMTEKVEKLAFSAKPSSPPWDQETECQSPNPEIGALPVQRPSVDLLDPIPSSTLDTTALDIQARERGRWIDEAFGNFKVNAKVVEFARGPSVTRYEVEPAPGEKIARISSLSNDLARVLAVSGVRVEGNIVGKNVIGLEVPNAERESVHFHATVVNPAFRQSRAKLPLILGKTIDGEIYVGDLAKMPHLLIAGSTGSGKSVCVNVLISSLLFRYLPQELRFIMIDPKMVELTPYDGIPHLIRPVVTNPADAAGVLLGCVSHMERRYKMMSQIGAKNLEQYNAKVKQIGEPELPHMVIIIDELADLMITSPKEVESAIMRLAQMARATGMHLMLATQRPSVDILTSLIKVNIPARVAFAVSSGHDSRTILDTMGAERLIGMGDLLFSQPGLGKPMRLQAPYISETETARLTEFLRRQYFEDEFGTAYGADFDGIVDLGGPTKSDAKMDFSDPLLRQAAEICIEEGQGSVSRLQRRLAVGHARAGKLMDMLEAMGIVSGNKGSKPRDILIHRDDLPEYFGR